MTVLRRKDVAGGWRILLLPVFVAMSPATAADIYKWVDKEGRAHYSNLPPEGAVAKKVNVPIPPAPVKKPEDTEAKTAPKEASELERLRREIAELRQELEVMREREARIAANPPQPQVSYVPYPVPVITVSPRHDAGKPHPHRPMRPERPPRENR